MRVLQLNSVYGSGSTGRIALSIDAALRTAHHSGWIAYGRGANASAPNAVRIGSPASVLSHVAMTRLFARHGLGSRAATAAFIRHVEALSPEIIHLHNIHGYYLNFELLFAFLKSARTPIVWTLHDCWAFTGHCAYYDFAGCTKWRAACYACPQRTKYPKSWLLDSSAPMYDRKRRAFTGVDRMMLVSPSDWLAGQVRESFLSDYPLRVVPNGIDLTRFAPTTPDNIRARFGIAAGANVVLGVAADFREPRKGLRYFLELAPLLAPDTVVVLVGMPNSGAKLPTNVVAITRTESISELAALYSTASVFVNPTLEDNFPTVGLEALACGAPVVTFATGGCAEQIDPACGIAVQTGSLDALAQAILEVVGRGKAHFAPACRARARRYASDRMCAEYLDLYTSLAEHSSS